MKKLAILFSLFLIVVSCKQEQTINYVSFSGNLENNKDSVMTILSRQGVVKEIKLDENGNFKDTLKVNNAAIYTIQVGNKRAPLYLKNGYEIKLNGDASDFMNSFKFSGYGGENTNFIIAQVKKSQSIGNPQAILDLNQKDFDIKVAKIKSDYDSILNSYNNLDSTLYVSMKTQNEQLTASFSKIYAQNQVMGKGKPSPKFENYVNIKGGKNSLKDYKGKYVYIDVWATWCGPCIQQIPFLKSLEKEYKNKNIEFISISTDESRRNGGSWEAAEKKWRDFVKEKDLSGVQLWSGQDYSFQQAYQITGIPRFILIDPQGNIVDANAPRPSDPRLKNMFNSLGI